MRTLPLLLTLLLAFPAAAQETADYSRDTLLKLFAGNPERDETERFRHRFGMIEFKTRNIRWRVGYLPFFLPLHGSIPWDHDQRWPDPFILTGTEIASTPRTWRDRRAMSAELRRIERKARESAIIRVEPD